jgi:multicomponent Na+:H+ antiporter subunit F
VSGAAFLELATSVAFVLLGLAFAGVLVRFVRGPSLADRILALDSITVLAAGAIGVFAVRTGWLLYVDIAVAISLVGVLSTAALARYLMSRERGDE